MKFPYKFLGKWAAAQGRHRGRSVAGRNARVNLVVSAGVVGVMLAAIVYAVAISGDGGRATEFEREIPRWWSAAQAEQGGELYQVHCAECHGDDAEGAVNWRERNEDGAFPPPPLDGSAHTWHHDMGALRRSIRFGGKPLGGTMPAFQETLSPEEIDSVIAHFQSLWPEEIYLRWNLREERRKR